MENSPDTEPAGLVARALEALVSQIPASREPPAAAPDDRAGVIGKAAAIRAAAVSGSFTLPPGPLGLATVLPDLLSVWRIQQQLVADVAAAFGRSHALNRETMLICLFKHAGGVTQHLFSRGRSNNVVVHRIANRALQQLLEKIAVRLAQRFAAKSAARWLPLLGAVGAGAYSYYDTSQVAKNAIELFSNPIEIEAAPVSPEPVQDDDEPAPPARRAHVARKPRSKTRRASAKRRRSASS